MDIIKKLTTADYISFSGLFIALISIVLLFSNIPKFAIFMSLAAFVLDILDGWFARRFKQESLLGREIDSYVDIFTYVIFSSLFVIKLLSPNIILGVITGYLILLFGGLRLIRFNNEGILKNKEHSYYRGVTVVHIYLLVLVLYYVQKIINQPMSWISTILLILVCPSMLSNFKSFKISNPAYFFLIILPFIILTLIF